MRNEMIGAVVRRAIEHPEFRKKLLDNPQDALSTHGFALEDAELAEIDNIRTSLQTGDVEQRLVSMAEKYGVKPM
ncbi:MAG TPA: hypothetical protein VN181_01125 [Thermoanaerobaculia bacterium]|nr:hypothetical protein [Thermoanaerobaculia bacterium]